MSTNILSTTLTLPNGQQIPNRIAKAAMTEGLADLRAYPSPELSRLYTHWAGSGCGVLITGNVQIDRMHLERPGNVVIDCEPDAQMHANALFEARRCLSCGNCFECDNCYGVCPDNAVIKLGAGNRFEFNYDYCKGCGICAAECPCGAIVMEPEKL